MTDKIDLTEEGIAGRIARQDADVVALEQKQAKLEVDFRDHAEDNSAKDFSERIKAEIARTVSRSFPRSSTRNS